MVVALHGRIAVDVDGAAPTHLEPPSWRGEAMAPRSPPAPVPFGGRHAVRTLGIRRSLFCLVIGVEEEPLPAR